ncbi:RhoGAP domain-containing protein [Paracoccidioides lutzii Pb01]|uniref:RhoGAP domain-containing protein n=1 Tax=Paracoccidioides lutzii (strain ATCC MYA-826 / Pb01) TaxID=502779 RepID=C1GQR6_PARBA|nr:RhoGAP domain-containing protein [Paracoccidioides lutzii Pb01]EEH37940.2 RhoGAP domain-containing protein [Paracoccidioides lutzii Pb01]
MPKPSSYDQLRNTPDPPRPVTMNSNNNNQDKDNNNTTNTNSSGNNGGTRVVTSPSSLSAFPTPSVSNVALHSAVGDRIRTLPRTSSIDSAISSISSAHSHKSSLDTGTVSPEEIANIIAAAGSAEAVIIHLLKEKQQAASQNAQLWRLVDKQRTMVLGLNKDLERAVKDKERYRKKLHELQLNNAPPVPQASAQTGGGDNNVFKDPVSGLDEAKLLSNATSQSLQDDISTFTTSFHVSRSQTEPSLNTGGTPNSNVSSPSASDGTRTEQRTDSSNNNNQKLHHFPTDLFMHEKQANQAQTSSIKADNDRTDSSSNATSSLHLRGTDMLKQTPPLRKPPPAPLNLRQTEKMHSPSSRANIAVGDDSDYGETMDIDEIPKTEKRGRRKTREEDDREREVLLLKEQAARSASSKMKSKMQNQQSEGMQSIHISRSQASTGINPQAGNRMVAHSPPAGLSGQIQPLDSLASMLSPPVSDSTSSDKDRMVISPPMSPGLPLSPRPGDRPLGSPLPRFPKGFHGNLASPPISPRPGLPLSPRSNKFPPAPFPDPMTTSSLPAAASTVENNSPTKPSDRQIPSLVNPQFERNTKLDIPTFDSSVKIDSPTTTSSQEPLDRIYRGLVSDQYPDLLLPPNALTSIDVKVASSRLRPSRNSYLALKPGEEEPVFTLGVFSRANRAELWRVEKVILALPQLDQQLKQVSSFSGKLPDRSIFSGHSPAKVDARRAALNSYFESILETVTDVAGALVVCQFLTADAIEPRDDETSLINGEHKGRPSYPLGPDGKPRIEGYLTKRGKNFGGWKARYFVLDGPELRYYESPGGPHMGTIKIHHAQIGKQSQPTNTNQSPSRADDDSDNQYRHAFLILEPKKKDSSALVRHVLCAESDEERDSWVEALLSYVETQDEEEDAGRYHQHFNHNYAQQLSKNDGSSKASRLLPSSSRKGSKEIDSPESPDSSDKLRSFSYDDVVAAEAPVRGPSGNKHSSQMPWDQTMHQCTPQTYSAKNISGPTNGAKIQDAGAWGNKVAPSHPSAPSTSTKEKKRSIWGFRATTSTDLASQHQSHDLSNISPTERREPVRAVFGLPLADAVESCGVPGLKTGLPAVVYRCIEYLRAKDAALEEGIFRLSGSNVVIKALKERFNTEGDLDFLAEDTYYDVHAVASLFKQYLRELPTTVLTRELHLDFIRVLELEDRQNKRAAFNALVHRLPTPNLTLLKALSQYLIDIINNSDVNKMTVRNVGIVFAPTLNIPAPVFSMFLTDFESIFSEPVGDFSIRPVEIAVDNRAAGRLAPEDIRSPRHQIFSDLPTPSYSQATFPMSDGHGNPQQRRDRDRDKYDTGFIPMQPTYEQHVLGAADPYNSMSNLLTPPVGNNSNNNNGNGNSNMVATKAKRRESNLLFMNLGNRRSGMPGSQKGKDDKSMVSEDSAFE